MPESKVTLDGSCKALSRAKIWLGFIPLAPIGLDVPLKVALDSAIEGNYADGVCYHAQSCLESPLLS